MADLIHHDNKMTDSTGTSQILLGWVLMLCSVILSYVHSTVMPYLQIILSSYDLNMQVLKDFLDILVKIAQLAFVVTGTYYAIKGGRKKNTK